jgi:hypothetical protein
MSYAQVEPSKYYVELGSGIGTASLNDAKTSLSTRDVIVAFGYDVSKKITLKLPLTLSSGMIKDDNLDLKSWQTAGTVGLGIGYNFATRQNYRWQLNAEAGNTLNGGNDAWKYFYYDVGAKFYLGESVNRVNAFVGFGVRQFVSNVKDTPDYLLPYVTLGFRLNCFK